MTNTMYVVTHKTNIKKINNRDYKYILVNANNTPSSNTIEYLDNTGDNISIKNPNYCELTALYWIWKNDKKSTNVGLSHYRRFFSKPLYININSILKIDTLNKYLKKYDVVLPCKSKTKIDKSTCTIYDQYAHEHYKKDIDKTLDIIKTLYPEYYDSAINFLNKKSMTFFNMFYMKKELLDKYCEWLFNILFTLEQDVNTNNYDDYQKRLFGFLSERLFNIWVNHNNLKIKYLTVTNIEKINSKSKIKNFVKYLLQR